MKRTRNNKAFTLVEILIVVVILGILAAIVVPQFTNAANDARGGNLSSQLSTLQSQIELFSAQNNGAYPDFDANGWDELTDGEYMKDEPASPAWSDFATRTSVSSGANGTGSAASAWFFNTTENRLYASFYIEPWIADPDNNRPAGVTTTATD